jgi:hypothetical protein
MTRRCYKHFSLARRSLILPICSGCVRLGKLAEKVEQPAQEA